MKVDSISFTAVGDVLIQRRIPSAYDGLDELSNFIQQGDMRYFNLETTLGHGDGYANQVSGGSWLMADPVILEDVKQYGLNMLSFATNHTLDFCHWGLISTIEALEASGIPHAGAGRNMAEAAAPTYLDTPKGRFALISVCSTFDPTAMAGEQSRSFIGRPGLNGLRFDETFVVTVEEMDILQRIAREIQINDKDDISRKEGYLPPVKEGCFRFGKHDFKQGEAPGRISTVNKRDMKRVEKAIYEAEFQADFIAVALHSHNVKGTEKETPDDFLVEFAHKCIDAGADAIIGTGPHILRPIEIYKNRPIFYSLGDFILQNENISKAPEEFYEGYGLTSDATMRELFTTRSNNFIRGLQTDCRAFESVVPYCEYRDGMLSRITLMPIELGFGKPRSINGLPKPAAGADFIQRLAKMSKPYGTVISENDHGFAEVLL